MKQKLTYISLFSSAGIGCYGFKQQGFECIATNELLEKRLDIQRYNKKCHYDSGYILGDISTQVIKDKLNAEIQLWQEKHQLSVDVIIATPPCQGMSVANHKKNNELGRNSLVVQSIKIVLDVAPKFFIFENVKTFLTTLCTDLDGEERLIGESISLNLGGKYNILSKVVNFKDYGSNSSRTRTLVIGVRKDIPNITPFDLFPNRKTPKTLRELFSSLPKLHQMGEISQTDIFHSYRNFDKRMLPWIENIGEGQSAFNNQEPERIPHQIKEGKIIYNQNKNGDKYSRWYWDRTGPCIHTRNDILASQNTIHPEENRVFSVRELMLMMTIHESFQWSHISEQELNQLTLTEKKEFLKKYELTIRHSIGEAVPSAIFSKIAEKIKSKINEPTLNLTQIKSLIKKNELTKSEKLYQFIDDHFNDYSLPQLLEIAEYANSNRVQNSAYFTRPDIAFGLVNSLPDFKNKKQIRILEPSVGIGNFLPMLVQKYQDKERVIIDVVDIDKDSLNLLQLILKKCNLPPQFEINIYHQDFLLTPILYSYDLVIGNPPYGKSSSDKIKQYKIQIINQQTNNLFSFFIEKSLKVGKVIALIVPKSLVNSPEFHITRGIMQQHNLTKIFDYGEKAFKGVKIETISFIIDNTIKIKNEVYIESFISETLEKKEKSYIFDNKFPYWLLYRNNFFDRIADNLNFNKFTVFRDRQITKKHTKTSGKFRVLKSRNVSSNNIIDIPDYDSFIDDIGPFSVNKFLNQENVVMVPNLTYKPRAAFLPKNAITDGSVALLSIKMGEKTPTLEDLAYFSTEEFTEFYKIARNFGTRSLNIDNHSVFFFGLLKERRI